MPAKGYKPPIIFTGALLRRNLNGIISEISYHFVTRMNRDEAEHQLAKQMPGWYSVCLYHQ